uniref:gamma-glutamylcyclotransferase n=1 Tax=Podarcis muralis TaxID=64176 RepID=A0A670KMA9_PODMU
MGGPESATTGPNEDNVKRPACGFSHPGTATRLQTCFWLSFNWHGSTATIIHSPGDEVWGVVGRMGTTDLPSLDRQEGVEEGIYIPIEVTVQTQEGKIKGCHIEEGERLFSAAPEKRTRSNGSKLQERRFHLNIRKNFLTVRAVRQWNLLPRSVVESPSLEVFKQRLDNHMSGVL